MSERKKGLYKILFLPAIYSAFQNIVGNKKFRIKLVEDYIVPKPNQRILDFGCGTADILKVLKSAESSIEYVGIDISAKYIKEAQKRYGNSGTFICQYLDETTIKELGTFDIILMQGLLHHIEDKEAIDFFNLLASAMNENSRLISIDACFHKDQGIIDHFLVSRDRGQNVRKPEQYNTLMQSSLFLHKNTIKKAMLRIPYSFYIMEGHKKI